MVVIMIGLNRARLIDRIARRFPDPSLCLDGEVDHHDPVLQSTIMIPFFFTMP
jgi:hypothetical protein